MPVHSPQPTAHSPPSTVHSPEAARVGFCRVLGWPWLAAAVFAVHPVCVASAAWISEQKNTLSLLFFLASFWCYEKSGEGRGTRGEGRGGATEHAPRATTPLTLDPPPSTLWYTLSLFAFTLALLSKTSTVMLPVLLLGSAWWQRGRVTRLEWLRAGPFFLLALGFGMMTIWFQAHQAVTTAIVQTESFWGRLAGAGWAVWFYFGRALLPVKLNLIYPRWNINAASPWSYLPLLGLAGVWAICWRFRQSWGRHALFGLTSYAVALFPALGFFDMYYLAISRVSDHFQYLPLIAVTALLAAAVTGLRWRGARGEGRGEETPQGTREAEQVSFAHRAAARRDIIIRAAIGATLLLGLSVLSFNRARVFATDEGLWRDTLAKNPAAWTAHLNLACILAERKEYDQAITHFAESLKLNPQNPVAHANLGHALMLEGRLAEAESHLQTALALKPAYAQAHKLLASLLAQQGKDQAALEHLRTALSLEPDATTRLRLAALLHKTGQVRQAIAEYRRILALQPESVEPLNNLAWLLATSPDDSIRDGAEAVRLAERACHLTGYQQAVPLGTLAAAYAAAGRFAEAVATAQKAADLAAASGNARFAATNLRLLEIYRTGRPYREER